MIQVATTRDVPAIRCLMEGVQGFWQAWWTDETVAEAIRSANGLAFVWEDQRGILGFACAHDFGFRAYLSELVVDAHVRRQGIATRLLHAVEEVLRKRGQPVLIADVWHDAERFYKSRGWRPPDVVLLAKRLKPGD